jgi:polyferredoxin
MVTERKGSAFSLAASIILSVFMALNVYMFIIARSLGDPLHFAGSLIWGSAIVVLYFLMLYTGKVSRYRKIFFVSFALLFAPTFIAILFETRGHMFLSEADMLRNEVPYCHIVTPLIALPSLLQKGVTFPARISGHFAAVSSMLVIWLTATIVIGRGWCSWVCFYGGWDEGASAVSRKPRLPVKNPGEKVRSLNFAMLMFLVLASLAALASVYCQWFCPFKMVTEFEEITGFVSFMATVIFIVIFFALVLVLPFLMKRRIQCATFCPFGAMQSLMDKASIYRVRIDPDKCKECMSCVRSCPMFSITEEMIRSGEGKVGITCSKCGTCVQVCKEGAATFSYSLPASWSKERSLMDRLQDRANRLSGPAGRAARGALGTFRELISPMALFSFSALTLGMILSSMFAPGTLQRLLNLFINGSFLLGG